MKWWMPAAVAASQIALLGYMAAEREWVHRFGQSVVLRTAPIDPADPMRGEYVRLSYDLNFVPRRLCRGGVAAWFEEPGIVYRQIRDQVVYARLAIGADNLAGLVELTDVKPTDGLFLRGRTEWHDLNTVHVRYGIEAFFMQQGKARQLEKEMWEERQGVLLNVDAAVGRSGIAVLRDFRWEPLGITLAFERENNTQPGVVNPLRGRLMAVDIEIRNHGEQPVAIADRPGGGSFRLVPNERVQSGEFSWVGADLPPSPVGPGDIIVLQSGAIHRARIDLALPRWFVRRGPDQDPGSMSNLIDAWNASFRIEYVPPRPDEIPDLPSGDLIFRRTLSSRAFTPAGGID